MTQRTDIVTLADQYRVAATVGRDLQEFCGQLGIDLETVARPLHLDIGSFEDFDALISFDRLSRLMEALAAVSGDDTFGLKYGQFYKFGGTGPFGMGLRCAPSFKVMLKFFAKYIHTTGDIEVFNLAIDDDRVSAEWTYSPLITQREQYVDFAVATTLRTFQASAGRQFKYAKLRLERHPPSDKSLFLSTISNFIEFGCASNSYELPADVLHSVSSAADEVMFKYMTQQCEALAKSRRRTKDIVTMLKEDFLQHMETNDRAIVDVARRLGMSERTLQRRLAENGVNFWEVSESTRDELSLRLLTDTDLPLSEISQKLGYSSQSAYTRAVKRWRGASPRQLREKLRSEPVPELPEWS